MLEQVVNVFFQNGVALRLCLVLECQGLLPSCTSLCAGLGKQRGRVALCAKEKVEELDELFQCGASVTERMHA